MSKAGPNSEAEILSRIIAQRKPNLPAPIAEEILTLDFPGGDRERMNKLAEKAREGTLTPEEQFEIDAYERVGIFLSLLQAKARSLLKRGHREVE